MHQECMKKQKYGMAKKTANYDLSWVARNPDKQTRHHD
jgi:hypothetical protein